MKTAAIILALTLASLTQAIGKEEKKTSGTYQITTEEMNELLEISKALDFKDLEESYIIKVYNDSGDMVAEGTATYGAPINDEALNAIAHKMDFMIQIDNVAYYRVSEE